MYYKIGNTYEGAGKLVKTSPCNFLGTGNAPRCKSECPGTLIFQGETNSTCGYCGGAPEYSLTKKAQQEEIFMFKVKKEVKS